MDCDICLESFNVVERRPKFLPCGHTFCLHCLHRLKVSECPVDRKELLISPDDLPDNFKLLDTVRSRRRVWCRNCRADAKDVCFEDHLLCSLKEARTQESQTLLAALEEGEAGIGRLVRVLDDEVLVQLAADCRTELERTGEKCSEARGLVQAALKVDHTSWEQARRAANGEVNGLAQRAALLADCLQDSEASWRIAVQRGDPDGGGVAWRGRVPRNNDAALGLLLCQMLCSGDLDQSAAAGRREEGQGDGVSRVSRKEEDQEGGGRGEWGSERGGQGSRKRGEDGHQEEQGDRGARRDGGGGQGVEREKGGPEEVEREERDLEEVEKEKEAPDEEEREEGCPEEVSDDGSFEEEAGRGEVVIGESTWEEQRSDMTGEEMAVWMHPGDTVQRLTPDGTPGSPLGVGRVKSAIGGVLSVEWPSGKRHDYRMADGVYQLNLSRRSVTSLLKRHRPNGEVVDLLCCSTHCDPSSRSAVELPVTAKTVVGLHCAVAPCWSKAVLVGMSSRVVELELVDAGREHMRVVRGMPHLRALHLRGARLEAGPLPLTLETLSVANVTRRQLQQVSRMPSLRVLEVNCPFDAPAPGVAFRRPVAPAGLRWLRTGVHPLSTALALVRAHAASLEALELVASTLDPYGCPDLAGQLRQCGLTALRRLLLVRRTAADGACRHDPNECKRQNWELRTMFLVTDIAVTVVCSECDWD